LIIVEEKQNSVSSALPASDRVRGRHFCLIQLYEDASAYPPKTNTAAYGWVFSGLPSFGFLNGDVM
jgi:hypothetical protein